MKKILYPCLLGVCLFAAAVAPRAQDNKIQQLKDFSRVMTTEGIMLTLVHLNEASVGVVFQPPTLYAMRARAKEATMLYVQGTTERPIDFDTSTFTIEQGSDKAAGTPSNIKNFVKGKNKIPGNERIDGVLTFPKLFDPAKGFTVKHGRDSVDFKFTPEQLKAMAPAPAPAAH